MRVAGWICGNCPAARAEFDSAAGCPRVWVCDEFAVYIVPSNAFQSPLPLDSVRVTTTQRYEQPANSTASLPSETASEAAPPRIDSIDLMADGLVSCDPKLDAVVTQPSAGDVEPMQCDTGDPARQRKRPRSRSLSPAAVAAGPPLVAKRSRTDLPLAANSLLSPRAALALTGANSLPTPPSGPGLTAPAPLPPAAKAEAQAALPDARAALAEGAKAAADAKAKRIKARATLMVDKRRWDRYLWFSYQVFQPKYVYGVSADGKLFNSFSGTVETNGYEIRMIDYKGGMRLEGLKLALGLPQGGQRVSTAGVAHDPLDEVMSGTERIEPSPSARAPMAIHRGLIALRPGQALVGMDPGVQRQYVAVHFTTFDIVLIKQLKESLASATTPAEREAIAAELHEVVFKLVRDRDRYQACSRKHYNHEVGNNLRVHLVRLWRKKYGLPEIDLKLSRLAGSLFQYTLAATQALPKYLAYAFDRRLARLKFFLDGKERQWWTDMGNGLKSCDAGGAAAGAVLLIGRNFGNFSMISSPSRAPVMARKMRGQHVDTHLVNENFSSQRCAPCTAAFPELAKDKSRNMAKPKDGRHATLRCPQCRDQRNRDVNAALNIVLFNIDIDKIVFVDGNPLDDQVFAPLVLAERARHRATPATTTA
ncbi:hypothetical protein H9P43_004653 [Blastocladiella emersonii ATCC 22665]|nr:hypothetical protein H9P43_004653 [Blastocladiella emersonii ATCC 22665]